MIFIAILLGLGLLALAVGATTSVSNLIANQQAKNVESEFARAKDALIGWSASRTPPTGGVNVRPGELPCPDMNNDGFEDGTCVGGALGRVPWKTLGIPEPKDNAGETLWYTLAGPFRIQSLSAAPITSDTPGTLTVRSNPGNTTATATTLTTQAVAVIFAPGTALAGQNRSATTTMACAAPSGTVARNLCASNYLETAVGPSGNVNNATINGPFIQANPATNPAFNDRLLVITNADLMPIVEQRVAREMRSLLQGYRAATATSATYPGGVYPWPDRQDGDSNNGENRHRFPCGTASPVRWNDLVPGSIPATNTPALPNWLTNGCGSNSVGWSHIIYYAAGKNYLETGVSCDSGYCQDPTLSVNSIPFEIVLLTPGAASASPRPNPGTGCTTSPPGVWPDVYFRDAENCDDDDDRYVTPTSTAYNRDRIFTVP